MSPRSASASRSQPRVYQQSQIEANPSSSSRSVSVPERVRRAATWDRGRRVRDVAPGVERGSERARCDALAKRTDVRLHAEPRGVADEAPAFAATVPVRRAAPGSSDRYVVGDNERLG